MGVLHNVVLERRWVDMGIAIKSGIKNLLLTSALHSPIPEACHASAQVISKLAVIELRRNEWPELVPYLLNRITSQESTQQLKEVCLKTLGYICEDISHEHLVQAEMNVVLDVVLQQMTQLENSAETRVAATSALSHLLDFAQGDVQRTHIVNMTFQNGFSDLNDDFSDLNEAEIISRAAMKCLVSIASVYNVEAFEGLDRELFFYLTSKAVDMDEFSFGLVAIQFFTSLCRREIKSRESGISNDAFVTSAVTQMVPILLKTLLKQEENQYRGHAYNISTNGGSCLGLVARAVGDAIVQTVMTFVRNNMTEQHCWRRREAAIHAFGSILNGPTVQLLTPLVSSHLVGFFFMSIKDKNKHVRYTTAWTLCRMFAYLYDPQDGYLEDTTIEVLIEGLRDVPKVAEQICGAISFLAVSNFEAISPHLQEIVEALVIASDCEVGEGELRAAAYNTLVDIADRFHNLTQNDMKFFILLIMLKIPDCCEEKQTSLRTVLQSIIRNLYRTEETRILITPYRRKLMSLFQRSNICPFCGSASHIPASCRDVVLWKVLERDENARVLYQGSVSVWKKYQERLHHVLNLKADFLEDTKDLMISQSFHISLALMQQAFQALKYHVVYQCFLNNQPSRFQPLIHNLETAVNELSDFWSKPTPPGLLNAEAAFNKSEQEVFFLTISLHVAVQRLQKAWRRRMLR